MASKRVLFVRLRSLGDTVLMTPALEVAKRIPGNKVGVVCEEPCDQLLVGNPHVDEIFVASRAGKLRSRLSTIWRVREFKPDIAIDLHGGTTSSLIVGLSGAKQRVGSERSRNSWLFNCRVPDARLVWERDRLHTVEDQLASLKFLGFPVEPIPPLWAPGNQDDKQFAVQLMSEHRLSDGFVLIHPVAALPTKEWRVEWFAELADRLIEDGLEVAATAGPGEEEVLNQLSRLAGRKLVVVAPLSLGRFGGLVSRCGLYVGNDTGPTHIAAALKRPIVVIFGSSDSKVWYPWQTQARIL
ncbi:MAG: glycosyltransferase family 9 protein, partial [bacterium]